jgi:hypothetical protein
MPKPRVQATDLTLALGPEPLLSGEERRLTQGRGTLVSHETSLTLLRPSLTIRSCSLTPQRPSSAAEVPSHATW